MQLAMPKQAMSYLPIYLNLHVVPLYVRLRQIRIGCECCELFVVLVNRSVGSITPVLCAQTIIGPIALCSCVTIPVTLSAIHRHIASLVKYGSRSATSRTASLASAFHCAEACASTAASAVSLASCPAVLVMGCARQVWVAVRLLSSSAQPF